jgi:hypothetical protein
MPRTAALLQGTLARAAPASAALPLTETKPDAPDNPHKVEF